DPHLSQDAFMAQMGQRVRARRREQRMSRRALSEASGVSERYLAQLEAGSGNISIVLLRRVAHALGQSVTELVDEDTAAIDFSRLFRRANPEQRRQVINVLDPETPRRLRGQRIALIGMRGAGKSTLGKHCSQAVGLPFRELNDEIQALAGMPLGEIFALYGAEGYRQMEAEALSRVAEQHSQILLGTGGGIVTQNETFAFLLAHYHTIWIKTSPDEHMARVLAQGDRRPIESSPHAMTAMRSILARRTTKYMQADGMVDTAGKSIDESAKDLIAAISDVMAGVRTETRTGSS
ncbi:MAG: helix-turn-helix transcriptional regulator, partial [Pseudomonadota bacterium]